MSVARTHRISGGDHIDASVQIGGVKERGWGAGMVVWGRGQERGWGLAMIANAEAKPREPLGPRLGGMGCLAVGFQAECFSK